MKNFAVSKISGMFAELKARVILQVFVCVAFFIATITAANAANKGYHSNGCCATRPVITLAETEKGSLSSFNNRFNFSFMARVMKNASSANDATTRTPARRKTVKSYKAFETEKNAKNQAYAFILSSGLLSQFADFSRTYESNPGSGIELILKMI